MTELLSCSATTRLLALRAEDEDWAYEENTRPAMTAWLGSTQASNTHVNQRTTRMNVLPTTHTIVTLPVYVARR